MTHILSRHHPEYWDGSRAAVQTFFNRSLTADQIANIAERVMQANRTRVIEIGAGTGQLPCNNNRWCQICSRPVKWQDRSALSLALKGCKKRDMILINTHLMNGGHLVPLDDYRGPVQDPLYLKGAIEMIANGKVMLSIEWIDLVDQLWAYLINGIEVIGQNKSFSCYFPDQAIRLDMIPMEQNRLKIIVDCHGETTCNTDRSQAANTILTCGMVFFSKMAALVPGNKSYQLSIAKINALKSELASK